jgi:hypothetical protein
MGHDEDAWEPFEEVKLFLSHEIRCHFSHNFHPSNLQVLHISLALCIFKRLIIVIIIIIIIMFITQEAVSHYSCGQIS